jgi:hypothetical protein
MYDLSETPTQIKVQENGDYYIEIMGIWMIYCYNHHKKPNVKRYISIVLIQW